MLDPKGWVNPVPEDVPGSVSRYFSGAQLEQTPDWYEADAEWKAQQVLRLMRKHALTPESVCDVGCGTGGVLDCLRKSLPLETDLVGYEVSPQALDLAGPERPKRITLVNSDVRQSADRYDMLLLLDVFEHVEDYLGFLRSLRHRSRWFIFHIPLDLSVQNLLRPATFQSARNTLGHLHYFCRETALASLREAGYDIVADEYTRPRIEQPAPTFRALLAKVPRSLSYRISPTIAVRAFGGFALIVLARAER